MEEKHSGCNRGPGIVHVDRTERRQAQRLGMKEKVGASGRGRERSSGLARQGDGRRDLGKGKAIGPREQAGGMVAPDPESREGRAGQATGRSEERRRAEEEARPPATLVLTSWQRSFR